MVKYNLAYYEEKLRSGNTTSHMVKKWTGKLDIVIHVANNEQKAWTMDMLDHPTIPMPTKAVSGYYQTGDYIMYLNDYNKYVGICGERKSISDLYGTLFGGSARFHREIDRFEVDERFDSFIVFIEGSLAEFLSYAPLFKGGKYIKKAPGKKNTQHQGAQKIGAINSLYARGVGMYFAGSRPQAATNFTDICHKWIQRNYENILELE